MFHHAYDRVYLARQFFRVLERTERAIQNHVAIVTDKQVSITVGPRLDALGTAG